jgi:thiol-disulfide isomerase/thioredoxin
MNYYVLTGVTTAMVLTAIAVYIFYSRKKTDTSDDATPSRTVEVFFFYTTWCPYCKKAVKEWEQFKNQWTDRKLDGATVLFSEVNCETNEVLANKFNVVSYPTIKLVKDDKVFDYDAKPEVSSLNQFLTSC